MSCAICLRALEALPVAQLPCGHTYHFHCFARWINVVDVCPLCRQPVTLPDPDSPRCRKCHNPIVPQELAIELSKTEKLHWLCAGREYGLLSEEFKTVRELYDEAQELIERADRVMAESRRAIAQSDSRPSSPDVEIIGEVTYGKVTYILD